MKRIVFICLFNFLVCAGFTQDNRSDSLAIDSLKHQLAISKPDTNRVEVLAGLSFFYKFSNPDSAFFYGQQAITLASKIHYPKGEIEGLLWLGVTNSALGNISKAMELCFKFFKIADKNNLVIYKEEGLALIGYYFMLSKNYSKALSYLYQALKISDPKRSSKSAFVTMYNLAYTYLDMNKLDSAAYYNRLASDIVNNYNLNVFRDRPYYIAAGIQYKKGNTQPAIQLLRQSLHSDSTGGDHSLTSVIPYEIAKIYQQDRQADSAIYYAEQSLEAAQRAKQYINIVQAGKLLSELYEPRDLQKALTYNKTAIAAQDTIHYFENSSAVSSLLEYDEKERQYEIETAQTAYKNKTRQYALVAGLGVFLLIVFILYRNNKKQQKANKLLHQQKEEINAALSQLKATQSQLIQSEKMASLGELTAGIAHEIQNPLNFVNNFSEVNKELLVEMKDEMDKGNLDDAKAIAKDVSDNEEKINHHGKRADAIVKGMLQHSRSSSGVKEPTDINALADEYLRLSYHGLRAKDKTFNAKFETDFDTSLPKINIVPQDIGRVILNLINNAFYAVTEKKKQQLNGYEPTVSVSTKKEGDKIFVSVKDNGNGIPQKVLDKIFQPFFTTKPTGEGTGLGLSLSYDIVKAHGGELKAETKEGEGSEFIIQLPVN